MMAVVQLGICPEEPRTGLRAKARRHKIKAIPDFPKEAPVGLSTLISQWLDAEESGDETVRKAARDGLVTALWDAYAPVLKQIASGSVPGQQSDILTSAFTKFVAQLECGKIEASTRAELYVILERRIRDKVSERLRKEARRKEIRPILQANAIVAAPDSSDEGSGAADPLAHYADSREPPPWFQAMINEIIEAVPDPRLREVLILKIEHLEGSRNANIDLVRSNAEIARILGVNEREVGRRLDRVREKLTHLRDEPNAEARSGPGHENEKKQQRDHE
jgi:RNA polymerase sigma factor (sigma-70 family)